MMPGAIGPGLRNSSKAVSSRSRRTSAALEPFSYTLRICSILPDDAPISRAAAAALSRRRPLDPIQGTRLHRGACPARQGRRGGAGGRDDAAIRLSAQGPRAAGRRGLGPRAGRRTIAPRQGDGLARRHFRRQTMVSANIGTIRTWGHGRAVARRRFGTFKVTLLAARRRFCRARRHFGGFWALDPVKPVRFGQKGAPREGRPVGFGGCRG